LPHVLFREIASPEIKVLAVERDQFWQEKTLDLLVCVFEMISIDKDAYDTEEIEVTLY
jgi:hypothetical protein